MAKGTKPKTAPKTSAKPRRARAPLRRNNRVERAETLPRSAPAVPVALAAEVERLERELAAARAQVAELAARADADPLTGIANRRGFERELKRSLDFVKRYGASAALLYFDLDGFKGINDRHGHAAGDAVLKAVAMVLARHVRASDLVARIGGDEFVLLLWNCSEAHAWAKAAALEAAIARTTATCAGVTLGVGVSCGVAPLLPLDQPADVLQRADRAMYARKAARGGVHEAAGA